MKDNKQLDVIKFIKQIQFNVRNESICYETMAVPRSLSHIMPDTRRQEEKQS